MANPMKAVKAVKKLTAGKAKAALRMAKAGQYDSNTKGLGLAKGSNKKVGASSRRGRGFIKSKVKEMVREEKRAGYAMDPKYFNSEIRDKGRNFGQFSSGNKKVSTKKRGN